MRHYIIERLLLAVPTLLAISLITFFGLRVLLPTSAVDVLLGEIGRDDPELAAKIEKEVGLDSSIPVQYIKWLGQILRGDFGESLHSGVPVTQEMRQRIPISLELGLWGLITALVASIPMGVYAAVKQDKLPDYALRIFAILINAVPSFWIAILVITFGSIWFGWAPPIRYADLTDDPVAHFKIILLPAIIIGLTPSAGLVRLVRTVMLEVLNEDYVRTARAKGLRGGAVLYRHALRNALIPVVTVVGVSLPGLIAGTVIFEQIFVLPGMGRYLVGAVNSLDYPVIQATNLIFATLLILSVLLVDISYGFLDPRIRFK